MANYITSAIQNHETDNAIKTQRCALAVLMKFIGYTEEQEISPARDQGDLKPERIMAIAATLTMVFTVARLAEIHRAVVQNQDENNIIILIQILKTPPREAEFKIEMIQDKSVCPHTWFKAWWSQRDPLNHNIPEQIRKSRITQKSATCNTLSKQIRIIMQAAGIPSSYSVTSVRTAALTKLIKAGASPVTVDRFTHHSDTASTVRQYYDQNNNSQARQLLASSTELCIQIVANDTADEEKSEDLRDEEENLLSELDNDQFTGQDQYHLEHVVQEKKTSDQENLDLENKFNMEGQLLGE
ncbi:MAG: hypothetical protein EZS28_049965, partial [Streblomastix strix]